MFPEPDFIRTILTLAKTPEGYKPNSINIYKVLKVKLKLTLLALTKTPED